MSGRGFTRAGGAGALLVGAAILTLWTASYRWAAELRLPVAEGCSRVEVRAYRGLLAAQLVHDAVADAPGSLATARPAKDFSAWWDQFYWDASYAGVACDEGTVWVPVAKGADTHVPRRRTSLILPFWLLFTFALLVPVGRLLAGWRTRHRVARGRCGDCGYDLGGYGGECPACAAARPTPALVPAGLGPPVLPAMPAPLWMRAHLRA
ncbi:MAG TPA: hypothetical protein VER17_06760, partial [Tepidisphaeraceae bacterium]|nr:hypothetical protein [Tepidisphaeraceae bacterium]